MDAGGWAERDNPDRPVLRSRLHLEGMHALGLQVANVSCRDLALEPHVLRSIADSVGVQLVSANILLHGTPWFPPYLLMRRRIDGRDVGIGITGVTLPARSVLEALPDSLPLEVTDPREAAQATLAILEQQSDIQILLASMPAAELDRLSGQLMEYDLIVCGTGDLGDAPKVGPAPVVLAPGSRCKYLGWAALRPAAGGSVVVTASEILPLDTKVPDDAATAQRVLEYKSRLQAAPAAPADTAAITIGGPEIDPGTHPAAKAAHAPRPR